MGTTKADKTGEAKEDKALALPLSQVKKIVKQKLDAITAASGSGKNVQINREALLACSESAKLFISFVAAAANDICQEKKRQTVAAEDVLEALKDLEFPEFAAPLAGLLEGMTKDKKAKAAESKAKRDEKKRKAEEEGSKSEPAAKKAKEEEEKEGEEEEEEEEEGEEEEEEAGDEGEEEGESEEDED